METLIALFKAGIEQATKDGLVAGIMFMIPLKRIYDNDRDQVIWRWFSPSYENGVFSWECQFRKAEE